MALHRHIRHARWLIPGLLALLLAACSSQQYRTGPAVAELVIHQPLTIPPGDGRLFLQGGKAFSHWPDEYSPHCSLELYNLNPQPFTLQPGRYPITAIQDYETPIVMIAGTRYAGLTLHASVSDDGDSPEDIMLGYHFWFAREVDPNLTHMTCLGALDAPWLAQAPSVAEINQLLGPIGSIHLLQPHRNLH